MNIDFELYKVFYHVAKYLSFSEASHRLYISQSAVSQSVKLLEANLGCKLFTRSTKQVRLTQEGHLLFKHIEQAYNFIKSGERSLAEIKACRQGEIRIAASDTVCKYYLIPYLKQFHQAYPQIKIQVINRTSAKCIELLSQGLVDLGVINVPLKLHYKKMAVQKLKVIQDVFVAGARYKELAGQQLALQDLRHYPLLMLEKHSVTREFFDALLQAHGLQLQPEIELGSVDLLIDLTKIGMGLSFLVQEYIADELAAQELFILPVQEKIPQRFLGVITHEHLPLPVAAQKFIECLHSDC